MKAALTTLPVSVYTDTGGGGMSKYYNEGQKIRQERYDKENTKGLYLKLCLNTDKDILDRLDEMKGSEGKQGYIKRLIREDIERGA